VWVGKRTLYILLFLFYNCFINKKRFKKKSDWREIKSAGDFVNFVEEGKKCGSENDKEKRN